MDPEVSICVPTYNGAAYLANCLDSILVQTLADFELLIVDDRSSDDTVAIAATYARRDARVRIVVNDANFGLVANWNRCVRLSRGAWIKFVFQDDVILSTCVDRMLAVAKECGRPIISCGRDLIFEVGTPKELREPYENTRAMIQVLFHGSNEWSAHEFSEALLRFPTIWNFLGEPSAVLLHRSVFERFGWFNPHLRMLCDFEYWARVASNTGNVHIPETLAKFRVHEKSVSAYYRQTAARRYRFEMLDPLLMLHEFAFHPSYAGLRAVAMGRRPRVNLVEEFWKRALVVRWYAKRAVRDRAHPDSSLLKEWREAALDCPRLASFPLRMKFLSKWRALKKTASLQMRRRHASTS